MGRIKSGHKKRWCSPVQLTRNNYQSSVCFITHNYRTHTIVGTIYRFLGNVGTCLCSADTIKKKSNSARTETRVFSYMLPRRKPREHVFVWRWLTKSSLRGKRIKPNQLLNQTPLKNIQKPSWSGRRENVRSQQKDFQWRGHWKAPNPQLYKKKKAAKPLHEKKYVYLTKFLDFMLFDGKIVFMVAQNLRGFPIFSASRYLWKLAFERFIRLVQ